MNKIRTSISGAFAAHDGLIGKFSWVALSGFMRQFAFFIVNGYIACRVSKEMFGTLSCAFGSLLVFIGIADFGLREIAWRDVARKPSRTPDVVNTVLAARLAMTLVAMIGFLGSAAIYCHDGRDWVIFLIYSLGLFFNMSSFDYPFLGRDRMETLSKSSAIAYAYYVPACLLSVHSNSSAWLAAFHFVVAHAIFFGLLYRDYRREFGAARLDFRLDLTRDYFRRSWPLGLNGLVFRLTINYPVLLLGLVLSSVAVGEYRLAEMVYALFTSLGLYLGSSMYTTYAVYDGERDGRVAGSHESALRTIFLVHLPFGFAFAALLPAMLKHFMHVGSSSEEIICLLLGISLPVGVATRYLKTCLPSLGLNAQLLAVNAASLAVGIGIGLGLMKSAGAAGIAVSVLCCETCGLGLILMFLKQKLPALRLGSIARAPAIVAVALIGMESNLWAMGWQLWPRTIVPLVTVVPLIGWIALKQAAAVGREPHVAASAAPAVLIQANQNEKTIPVRKSA